MPPLPYHTLYSAFILIFRLSSYRLQLGHHDERRVRHVLNNTFQHLTALSELSTLTRDELDGVTYHNYRFMGELGSYVVEHYHDYVSFTGYLY